ncbi:MAG TPA: hypothetical protein VNI53_03135 [Gammaproteobacteria bacterium]|nr:hypothetical protein [Gammaproteobacteria bacterium]
MKSKLRFLNVVIMLTMPLVVANAADSAQFDLLKDMSASDYRATGLDKLSDAQVKALSTWFANYESQHAKECAPSAGMASASAPVAAASKPATLASAHQRVSDDDVTTSRISGKFSGWYGGTLFKLENGQTWEQTDDSVMTIAAMQNPEVTISKGAFNVYYLEVKGLVNSVPVRKVQPGDSN